MITFFKKRLERKTYQKLLEILAEYVNKFNKIDFDSYKKDTNPSKNTFNDMRAELSRK